MHDKSVAQLVAGLRDRQFSSVELSRCFLERIARLDSNYNSFITVDESAVLALAAAADQRIAAGDAATLTGIPIAHKDIFCTDGMRTSCGSRMLDNFVPPYELEKWEKALPGARVVTLPDCGHALMAEQPDAVLDALRAFL